MPTTVAVAFEQFRRNLEITDPQTGTVSTRQEGVRDALNRGMNVVEDFLTGSYRRQTMISPLKEADVDVFVALDASYFTFYNGQNGGPAGLLDWVRRTLRETYTRTPDISRNGQAVTIRFNDFLVDVVPGFRRQGGGYIIANGAANAWLSTDPKIHVEIFSEANVLHAGNLVPLIKMIKAWNKSSGSYFTSFHLEVLARQVFMTVMISDMPSGVRFFFDKARSWVAVPLADPAGYDYSVGRYLDSQVKIDEARRRLSSAYELAVTAERLSQNPLYNRSAIDTWRRLFPDHFPAYG
ncbi:MAG: hypothetical protein QOJ15_3168 [Bradyrhizobium sp.]|jgi:hypothetical protein|nr:hypothetical protein [Bradyrhizobium sp.]